MTNTESKKCKNIAFSILKKYYGKIKYILLKQKLHT